MVPPMLRSLVVLQLADPLLLLQLAEHVRIQALHFDMAQFHPTTWDMQGWLGRRCSALHQYQWVEHEHVVRRSALGQELWVEHEHVSGHDLDHEHGHAQMSDLVQLHRSCVRHRDHIHRHDHVHVTVVHPSHSRRVCDLAETEADLQEREAELRDLRQDWLLNRRVWR